jgi:hypothetical protein
VLQVNVNPTINATLKIGAVTEQAQVTSDAALVETRSNGVGQVIDQQRVVELPLNGRVATELIFLYTGWRRNGCLSSGGSLSPVHERDAGWRTNAALFCRDEGSGKLLLTRNDDINFYKPSGASF